MLIFGYLPQLPYLVYDLKVKAGKMRKYLHYSKLFTIFACFFRRVPEAESEIALFNTTFNRRAGQCFAMWSESK